MFDPAAAAGDVLGLLVLDEDRGEDGRVGGGGLVGTGGGDGHGEAAEAGPEQGLGAEAGRGEEVEEGGGGRGGRHFIGFWEDGAVAVSSSRGLRERRAGRIRCGCGGPRVRK